jgi:mannosyltransferase OCH1-like enzyme
MIPKILHFIWVGDETKRPDNCIDTWRTRNPSWEIMIWGNESLQERGWINGRHMTEMAERELNGVADMMRWEIVYEHGGFVVDADSVCLRPLDDHLLDCEAFACWESEMMRPGLIAAGYFAAQPKNPFVAQIIGDIYNEPTVVDRMAWESVGPQRLTDSYRQYRYHGLRIYPSHYFIPEHFTHVKYDGPGPVYADQLWGSTLDIYDALHQQALTTPASAPAPAPAPVDDGEPAPVAAVRPAPAPTADNAPGAPTIFHRIWFGTRPIPAAYEAYWQAWQRQFPDSEFRTWTDRDLDRLTLSRPGLDRFASHVSRADLARYEILYTHGGIYLDCDIMPYAHFVPEELCRELTVCNETEATEYCSIGFIGAPAGHPIFRDLIDHILAAEPDESRPNVTTGPWLFGKYLAKHAHRRLPPTSFYPYLYDAPFSSIRRKDLGKTLGIHVWGGAWLPPELKKSKALDLLGKGDLVDAAGILEGFEDKWAGDLQLVLKVTAEARTMAAEAAHFLSNNLAVAAADRPLFEFDKIVAWLLEQNRDRMVWQIGAADGVLVDPLRSALVNYDPPALLLEPNPYMFGMLERGYANNRNAVPVQRAYSVDGQPLVLNAINPNKAAAAGLPRWVLGISSVYDDKNAIGGLTIDPETTRRIGTCIERITVPVTGFDALATQAGGRPPEILVIDAEGMDKVIIDDVLDHGCRPAVIHFEVQCMEPAESAALTERLENDYVLFTFGNDVTAYRTDIFMEYAKWVYIYNGLPTIFASTLPIVVGLVQ